MMLTDFLASTYDASSLPIPGINHAVAKGDRECEIPGRRRRVAEAVGRVRKKLAAGESTANSSLKLGADSGRVMDDSGIVKRCFALEFRRKLSSLPWQPAPHSDN